MRPYGNSGGWQPPAGMEGYGQDGAYLPDGRPAEEAQSYPVQQDGDPGGSSRTRGLRRVRGSIQGRDDRSRVGAGALQDLRASASSTRALAEAPAPTFSERLSAMGSGRGLQPFNSDWNATRVAGCFTFRGKGMTGRVAQKEKIRISVHPDDYTKALDLLSGYLLHSSVPFAEWKALDLAHPSASRSTLGLGGQITLYPEVDGAGRALNVSGMSDFQSQVNSLLATYGIAPGQALESDLPLDSQGYFHYRHADNDRLQSAPAEMALEPLYRQLTGS